MERAAERATLERLDNKAKYEASQEAAKCKKNSTTAKVFKASKASVAKKKADSKHKKVGTKLLQNRKVPKKRTSKTAATPITSPGKRIFLCNHKDVAN